MEEDTNQTSQQSRKWRKMLVLIFVSQIVSGPFKGIFVYNENLGRRNFRGQNFISQIFELMLTRER